VTERWTPSLEDFIDAASFVLGVGPDSVRRPDGNKRTAFLLMARFLDANGLVWGTPDVITDAGTVERIAAGEVDRPEIVAWIERRTRAR
jgi:hypothetical protein